MSAYFEISEDNPRAILERRNEVVAAAMRELHKILDWRQKQGSSYKGCLYPLSYGSHYTGNADFRSPEIRLLEAAGVIGLVKNRTNPEWPDYGARIFPEDVEAAEALMDRYLRALSKRTSGQFLKVEKGAE